MTGDVVYETILHYLRKDKRGLSLTIDEYNKLSVIVNKRILAAYCSHFEEDIESSSDLGFLKVMGWTISCPGGIGTLPNATANPLNSYYRMIGEPYYTDASVTPSKTRYIDILTSKEHSFRQRDYLTQATTTYPTCIVGTQDSSDNLQIRVSPSTISTIYIDYLRETVTPYLDYKMHDTTYAVVYLTQGETASVVSPYTYRDGTTGAKTSLTKDWEWSEDDLPLIVVYFLDALGIVIPDTLLLEAGKVGINEILNE